jgi:hypothetical protein
MYNKVQHYTASGGGGTLVNSRPCAQSYGGSAFLLLKF